MKRDFYEVLKVNRSASEEEIKRSYRKLAQEYHPDKNQGDPKSEEMFKELGAAYEVLMNAEKRAAYDRFGHDGPVNSNHGGGPFNPFDVFNSAFNGAGFSQFFHGNHPQRHNNHASQRGEDILHVIQVTLEEVHTGVDREINLKKYVRCEVCKGTGCKQGSTPISCSTCHGNGVVNIVHGPFHVTQPCPGCHGSGSIIKDFCTSCNGEGRSVSERVVRISVPRGIDTNTRLRIAGDGSVGTRGGAAGDLFFHIEVLSHDRFTREGFNLSCKIDVPFVVAVLGGEITIQGIIEKHTVNIPPGTQTDTIIKISNTGLQHQNSTERGDILAQVKISVPIDSSKEQRDALLIYSRLL